MSLYVLTSWKVILQSCAFFALWCSTAKQNKAPKDDSIWTKGESFNNHQEGYHCSRSPTVSCSSMGAFLSENVGVFSSFCFLNGKNWMLWLACLIFTAGLALLWAMWSSVTVLVLAPELSEHLWVLGYPDLVWCFLLLERLFSSRKTAATRHHTIFQDLPTSATEEGGEGEKKEKGEEGRKRSNKDI